MRKKRLFELPVDADVAKELDAHLGLRAEELVAQGWEPGAAREEAVRLFGNVDTVAAECRGIAERRERAIKRASKMEAVWQDVKFGMRTFARAPGFAFMALLTLGLGIGANTAIFSVVNRTLLRPLPYPDADRLVRVFEVSESSGPHQVSYRNFDDWRREARTFDALAAYQVGTTTVLGGTEATRASVTAVSGEFFDVFAVSPRTGRTFVPEESREGSQPAVVVSQGFWATQLGADGDLANKALQIGGLVHPVVGVMPAGFDFPPGTDMWATFEVSPQAESRTAHNYRVVGRVSASASVDQAGLDLNGVIGGLQTRFPDDNDAVASEVRGLQEQLSGPVRRPLLLLLGAAALVLLVACSNIASTLLARGAGRQKEIAVRVALGASRGRVVRQMITESLLLALAGAAVGLLLAALTIRGLLALGPAALTNMGPVQIDGWVLGFGLLVAVGTALLFGSFPALQALKSDVHDGLRQGGRGGSVGRGRLWSILVGSEIALALILLTGSGLLIKSFWTVLSVDSGFDPTGVITASLSLPASKYDMKTQEAFMMVDPAVIRSAMQGRADPRAVQVEVDKAMAVHNDRAVFSFYQDLLARVQSVPGVTAAGLIDSPPLSGRGGDGQFEIEGDPSGEGGYAAYKAVSQDYFVAMGIPLVRGRMFEESDDLAGRPVILVNQALADRTWPGEDPIGKRIRTGGMDIHFWDWTEVVGVVGDVRGRSLDSAPVSEYYVHYLQRADRLQNGVVVMRTQGDAAPVIQAVRGQARALDSEAPVEFGSMEGDVSSSVSGRRFTMLILGAFAALALVLACVGIYGVVSYSVAQRTKEMGIRMAIGAQAGQVLELVFRGTTGMLAVGLIAGLVGSLLISRTLQSLLYEVSPTDPLIFVAVLVILLGATAVACYLPARRATRIDPVGALRAE